MCEQLLNFMMLINGIGKICTLQILESEPKEYLAQAVFLSLVQDQESLWVNLSGKTMCLTIRVYKSQTQTGKKLHIKFPLDTCTYTNSINPSSHLVARYEEF